MSKLSITLIDVGWGDSILVESEDSQGKRYRALIDSNDTKFRLSSHTFLKKHFEKQEFDFRSGNPTFDFVLLTHDHEDHSQGLKKIFSTFRARRYWYPKSHILSGNSNLTSYCNRYPQKVEFHEAVNSDKRPGKLGDVKMEFIWPHYNQLDQRTENNNSVVLALTLGNVSAVLGGDAEGEAWEEIAGNIPSNTRFFKVPHHGSVNGTFLGDKTPWFDHCPDKAVLAISSHVKPFTHPDEEVTRLFDDNARKYYRTDEHYHVTFQTDGDKSWIKYSRAEEL
jgi:competence protein ComEC